MLKIKQTKLKIDFRLKAKADPNGVTLKKKWIRLNKIWKLLNKSYTKIYSEMDYDWLK